MEIYYTKLFFVLTAVINFRFYLINCFHYIKIISQLSFPSYCEAIDKYDVDLFNQVISNINVHFPKVS